MNSAAVQSTDKSTQEQKEKLPSNILEAAMSLVGDNNMPPRFCSVSDINLYQTARKILEAPTELNSMLASGKIRMGDVSKLCDATSVADRILQFSKTTGFTHDCLNLITPLRGAIETVQDLGSEMMVMELIRDGTPSTKSYRQYLNNSNSLQASLAQINQKTGLTVNISGLPAQIKFQGERRFNELLGLLVKNVRNLYQMPEMSAAEISQTPCWDQVIQKSIDITDEITQLVTGHKTVTRESLDLAEYSLPGRGRYGTGH
jgi:hypothetical protein